MVLGFLFLQQNIMTKIKLGRKELILLPHPKHYSSFKDVRTEIQTEKGLDAKDVAEIMESWCLPTCLCGSSAYFLKNSRLSVLWWHHPQLSECFPIDHSFFSDASSLCHIDTQDLIVHKLIDERLDKFI